MIRVICAGVMAATLVGTGGCRTARRSEPPTTAPKIASLAPDSVPVLRGPLAVLAIHGEAFETGDDPGNLVQIGPVTLRRVPANRAGTEIRVIVPSEYPSGGEAPPIRMAPGDYNVTVRTRAGVSNAVKVRVVE